MEGLRCPRCRRDFVVRSPIKTGFQRLLKAAHLYRFRCQFCDHQYTAFYLGGEGVREEEERRREYERVPTRVSAVCVWTGGEAEGIVTDLSIAGCSLLTTIPVPADVPLQLQLRIAPEVPPIAVDAAVVRHAGSRELGLQFLRMRDEEKDRLQQYVLGSARSLEAVPRAMPGRTGSPSRKMA